MNAKQKEVVEFTDLGLEEHDKLVDESFEQFQSAETIFDLIKWVEEKDVPERAKLWVIFKLGQLNGI